MKSTTLIRGSKSLIFTALLVILISCNKEKQDVITLNTLEKTLQFGDKYQIEATSNSPIVYTVDNEYHAEISGTGLITARFIGQTNIILKNTESVKTFKVNVTPKYTLYPEPNVKFGDEKDVVIAKIGSNYAETSTAIGYENYSSAAPMALFTFDSNNKLVAYAILVKSSYSSTLANFLIERYLVVSMENDTYIFINGLNSTKATTIIGLELYNLSYWMVMYFPNTSATKSPNLNNVTLRRNINEMFGKIIEK